MSYFYNLSKALSSPAHRLAPRDGSTDAALTALTAEFDFILAGIVLTGSLVNAHALCRPPKNTYSILTFLPPDAQLWSAAAVNELAHVIEKPVIATLSQLNSSLQSAKLATNRFYAKQLANLSIDGREWFQLSHLWRVTSREARETHAALAAYRAQPTKDAVPSLVQELRAVEAGETPLIDQHGDVMIPETGERRKHARRRVDEPAHLYVRDDRQKIRIKDISATGLGLSGSFNLTPGTAVTVETGHGRLLPAVVVWSKDGSVGVRLSAILFNSDPLLNGPAAHADSTPAN